MQRIKVEKCADQRERERERESQKDRRKEEIQKENNPPKNTQRKEDGSSKSPENLRPMEKPNASQKCIRTLLFGM